MTEVAARLEKFFAALGYWNSLGLVLLLMLGVLYLGSRVSGWNELARRYPGEHQACGEWLSMPDFFGREGRGGMVVDFNHGTTDAIQLGVNDRGLCLAMAMPLRLFHPPIFVPWREVSSVALAPLPWSENKYEIRFTFAASPGIPLDVDLAVAAAIESRAEGRWTMPADAGQR